MQQYQWKKTPDKLGSGWSITDCQSGSADFLAFPAHGESFQKQRGVVDLQDDQQKNQKQ